MFDDVEKVHKRTMWYNRDAFPFAAESKASKLAEGLWWFYFYQWHQKNVFLFGLASLDEFSGFGTLDTSCFPFEEPQLIDCFFLVLLFWCFFSISALLFQASEGGFSILWGFLSKSKLLYLQNPPGISLYAGRPAAKNTLIEKKLQRTRRL